VGCARKVSEKYHIPPTKYFVVTEMGIEKKHAFDMLGTETNQAVDYIKSHI
jgi:uncharacterized metal-binding protein